MASARAQQLEQQLHACELENVRLRGNLEELRSELVSAQRDAEDLRRSASAKRQRDGEDAAACADLRCELHSMRLQLAERDAALRESDRKLEECRAALAACREDVKRRSSGGSHHQPEGAPAGGAAEGGGCGAPEAPAVAAPAPGEARLTTLMELKPAGSSCEEVALAPAGQRHPRPVRAVLSAPPAPSGWVMQRRSEAEGGLACWACCP